MKTYTINELKKLTKEQGYKSAALENLQGERLLGFNTLRNADINAQFIKIENRLKNDIIPNGYYNLLLAINPKHQSNPDKFCIIKGSPEQNPAPIIYQQAPQILAEKTPEVLTWSEALKLHSELAQLREENKTLKAEIERLSYEDEEETAGLNEPSTALNLTSFLKEQAPTIIAMADRFFNLEEKKIDLKNKELDLKNLVKPQAPAPKKIIAGSKEHLILIEMYYKNNNDSALNSELNKLEAANPELYAQVLERMNLAEQQEETQND